MVNNSNKDNNVGCISDENHDIGNINIGNNSNMRNVINKNNSNGSNSNKTAAMAVTATASLAHGNSDKKHNPLCWCVKYRPRKYKLQLVTQINQDIFVNRDNRGRNLWDFFCCFMENITTCVR